MKFPQFNSLRANIITVVVLASSLAVGLFTALVSYVNTRSSIAQLDSRLATLADVIGQNSAAGQLTGLTNPLSIVGLCPTGNQVVPLPPLPPLPAGKNGAQTEAPKAAPQTDRPRAAAQAQAQTNGAGH